MAFPTTIDSLTDVVATAPLGTTGSVGITSIINSLNTAVEALETKVGADSSAVTTSHDYKLSGVTGTDLAVSKTGTETLTNKTLTSPTLTSPTMTTPTLGVATATSVNKVTITAPTTSATLTLVTGSSLITAGAYAITLTSTATTGVTLPTTGTLATLAGTETFSNKRNTKRITTITSHATPTINTDNCDCVTITAQAEAITSMTSGLSGTPNNFDTLIIRIKDNGTARTITWGTSWEAKGVSLPTTTVISKVLTIGFLYDTVTSKWGCVASAQEV